MKSTCLAWFLVVALTIGGNGPVQARPASHFGTPSSMRSGFSSQKSIPTRSVPASGAPQKGPGAFGKAGATPPAADPRSASASSRDMEQNVAQANALKTLDARRAATSQPLSPPVPVYNQPAYPQQLPQPIIVQPQQQSNWLMHGMIGYMLGRAMSQQTQVSYPPYGPGVGAGGAGSPGTATGTPGAVATVDGVTAPVAAAVMTPLPAPVQHSFAATVLRAFFWLALVSGLVWLVLYVVWKLRRIRAANAAHYSFERN